MHDQHCSWVSGTKLQRQALWTKTTTPGWQLPHLHIALGGIDMIKEGLDCHPFDGNPALEEEGISVVLSSVTKVLSHVPLAPALERAYGTRSWGRPTMHNFEGVTAPA